MLVESGYNVVCYILMAYSYITYYFLDTTVVLPAYICT